MSTLPLVIVGSGMAGYTLAREIRKIDSNTPITLITGDDGASYSKPQVSNALAQNKNAADLVQKTADEMATSLSITVRTFTRVIAIDRAAQTLALMVPGGHDNIAYGRLVLATGATPRDIAPMGRTDAPVRTVNNLIDYAAWRRSLKKGDRVLVVGAGLIGVEFANDLAVAGHPVTVVDPSPRPLGRLLPEALGPVMIDALTSAAIALELGQTVTAFEADKNATVAVLDSGRRIAFDTGLVAIGLTPNTDLAVEAGLTVDVGIKVDAFLSTSDPAIFSLGDGAQTPAGVLPFVLPLMAEARALAKTLTGTPTPLVLPALPVAVKTPALPTVVCPPAPDALGDWTVEGDGADRRALFTDASGHALGFALTGACVSERMSLAKTMPDLLSANTDLAA